MEQKYTCRYCGKECKNANSLRNHERLCRLNPDRQFTKFSDTEWQKNKIDGGRGTNQYIKAKKAGKIYIVSEETRQKLSEYMSKNNPSTKKENREKIQQTVLKKVLEGSWHFKRSLYHNIKKYEYNGIILFGNYEYQYAKYLDEKGIKWEKPVETFEYIWNGKTHRYLPDFYLIETEEYVEIKGIETEKDRAKWSQFPKKLKVLKRKDLRKLGLKV